MFTVSLLSEDWPGRSVAAALMLLPPLFILFSRRCTAGRKVAWVLATQLPWLFLALYWWVWEARYSGAEPLSLADALGWWTLAFPWAVYLLYRATRARFSGEKRA
ncbi:MAG TPA: hypothetical protein VM074_02220 [Solimonas sp.]|nr:hypothetical protein [Solimonas sp.]